MFVLSRRVVLLALVAATALLAPPASAATTDSITVTDTAADQITEPYYSDATTATEAADEEDTDEPVDSGLDCSDDVSGDGQCDDANNSEACGYDGGDCCECTCVPESFNCGGAYNCIDPSAECVEDDDGDGGVMTTADLETDDQAAEIEDAEEDADNDTDAAAGLGPRSLVSAGLAAAAGAAVVALAGWGL